MFKKHHVYRSRKNHNNTRRESHPGTRRNVRTARRNGTNDTKFLKLRQIVDATMANFTTTNGAFRPNVMFSKASNTSIHKSYHLNGHSNYGVWVYQMKHVFERNDMFTYYITPPSGMMTMTKAIGRKRTMSAFNSNAKNIGLKLMKRYDDLSFIGPP